MRRPRPIRWAASPLLSFLVFAVAGRASAAPAQEPPDTLPPDTLPQEVDSVAAEPDSVSADTIFYNLPELQGRAPAGWATAVWVWNRDELMASGASTVAELFDELPGVLTLTGGDFGTPITLSAFGLGAGGLRVIRDGFEVLPVAGGVVDLGRIGLAGIERVRLDRGGGEVVVELWSHTYEDGRPYSLIEAGTGELDTNFFRGLYADPTALWGSLGLALERNDTRGPRAAEAGSRTASWMRYQVHRGDDLGMAFELRRATTENDVEDFAASASRRDWTIRVRGRLAEGLSAELYTGGTSFEVDDERPEYLVEGGSRGQQGLRVAYSRFGAWARAELRAFGGGALPAERVDLVGGYADPWLGGAEASFDRSTWRGRAASAVRLRGWTGSVLGLSAFGSYETGTHGGRLEPLVSFPDSIVVAPDTLAQPFVVLPDTLPRAFALTERSLLRVGGLFSWGRVAASAAALRLETDSLLPLGLELDRGAPLLPGGSRTGFELWGSLPTLWPSLAIEGSLQQWGSDGRYLPEQIYRGAFVFHRRYRDTFELWWTVGVRGRDPMTIHRLVDDPAAPPGTLVEVPFFQSWYGRIQIRIVTMRIFIDWENLSVRRNLQDFPDRVLPHTRAVYGIRWTLWN